MIMLLAAFGMVSRMRYQHVVSRYLGGRVGFGTITKIVILGLLLLIHLQGALAAGFALYAMSAPGRWLGQKMWRSRRC